MTAQHRQVKQPVTMNSPALTPAFHQSLETLLREKKKCQPKSPNLQSLCSAIHFILSSLGQPPYRGPVAPLLGQLLVLCQAALPGDQGLFAHRQSWSLCSRQGALQTALGLGPTAALGEEHPGHELSAAATQNLPRGKRLFIPHLSWRTQPYLWSM